LITGIGVITAIVLISSLPLFSSVMSTAGLRNVLRAQSNSAQVIANNKVPGISSSIVNQAQTQVNSIVRQHMGTYISGSPQVEIDTGVWSIYNSISGFNMQLYGAPLQTAHSHLQLLQGRLPVETVRRLKSC
jgi:hypothetical protein